MLAAMAPWVRFDDQFPNHRKVAGLKDGAYRVHTEAIFWCSRNLTDGVIRAAEINQVRARADRHVAEILAHDVWHEAGYECPSEHCPPPGPDGWVIHDYWDYQPSRDKVEQERAARHVRQQRWLSKRNRDASQDASQDASVTLTPARPVPKGRGPGPGSARRPVPAVSPSCPKHRGQPADNCAICRSETLAGDAS